MSDETKKRAARVLIALLKRKKITIKIGDKIRHNFFTSIDFVRENPGWHCLAKSGAECCKRVSLFEFEKVASIIAASQYLSIRKPEIKNEEVGPSCVYEFYRKKR